MLSVNKSERSSRSFDGIEQSKRIDQRRTRSPTLTTKNIFLIMPRGSEK